MIFNLLSNKTNSIFIVISFRYSFFVIIGYIIDYFGRRRTIIINAFVFFAGALILACAPSYALLVSLFKICFLCKNLYGINTGPPPPPHSDGVFKDISLKTYSTGQKALINTSDTNLLSGEGNVIFFLQTNITRKIFSIYAKLSPAVKILY